MDKLYLDRTFNKQDWFALRQAAIKRNYKTTQEAYDAIKVGPSVIHACMHHNGSALLDPIEPNQHHY